MKNDKKSIDRRLSVLRGQINGVRGMVEKDRSYFDIRMQLKSIISSLENIDNLLIEKEIQSKDENTKELIKLLRKSANTNVKVKK